MKSYDIIIVGAGPAGMSAALSASRDNRRILLLEGSEKIGKKILMTGNGKCNLTNTYQDISCYRSETPDMVRQILDRFGPEETAGFFRDLGIMTRDKNGYIYPYNEQASSVRHAFASCIRGKDNISILTGAHVDEVIPSEKGYRILTADDAYTSSAVIMTTGGYAGPQAGCDGSGLAIARFLGHRLIPTYPSLTALKSPAPFLKKISGVRNQARITLNIEGRPVLCEYGELQWTGYGISGVAVFQISRYAVIALEQGKTVSLSLDFMQEMEDQQLFGYLCDQIDRCNYKTAREILLGFLPEKLTSVVLREARLETDDKLNLSRKEEIHKLVAAIKSFPLRIDGYMGYEKAQVTRGGVPLNEVSGQLESVLHRGLFFAGEILDVDGSCGGYNLQWAFSSGNVAGRAAADYVSTEDLCPEPGPAGRS